MKPRGALTVFLSALAVMSGIILPVAVTLFFLSHRCFP